MKKLYLLLFLLVFAFSGCDSGSNSNSGGGGGGGVNMNGSWSGQWAGKVEVLVEDPNKPGTYIKENRLSGGPLTVHLTQNGKQLTGEVLSQKNNILDGGGRFTATLSNPNGSGNVELGAMWNDFKSVSFYGTYSNNQIYCQIGTPTQAGTGTFTLTR